MNKKHRYNSNIQELPVKPKDVKVSEKHEKVDRHIDLAAKTTSKKPTGALNKSTTTSDCDYSDVVRPTNDKLADEKIKTNMTPSKTSFKMVNDFPPAGCSRQRDLIFRRRSSNNSDGYGFSSKEMDPIKSTSSLSEQTDSAEKVKTKLMSVWNNMKYGWTLKVKTNFKVDSDIWLLGQCYHKRTEGDDDDDNDDEYLGHGDMELFKADFTSRLWFTYRRAFPVLAGSSLTTDCGWGCMLRSGQMLLAQALVFHFLKRNWTWIASEQTRDQDAFHRQIIKWFADSPPSPFSVHRLVTIGQSSGKKAGDWYGPASVAYILKDAMENAVDLHPLLSPLCVYVATDCTVHIQDVLDLCITKGINQWRSVIILVPVRLGGDVLNPIYIPCLQELLKNEFCLGIIGGRPKHSLYFVGWQDDKLIHLDPHYCQEVVNVRPNSFALESFHCTSPRKMSFTKMDPSCTIGFYCRTKEDLEDFIKLTTKCVIPPNQRVEYPMFVFCKDRRKDQLLDAKPDQYLRITHTNVQSHLPSDPKDDFVFL